MMLIALSENEWSVFSCSARWLLFKDTLTIQPLWWYHVYIDYHKITTMHMIYTISKVWKWTWTWNMNWIALLEKEARYERRSLVQCSFKHCVFFFIWFQCGKTLIIIIVEILNSFLLFCTYKIVLNVPDRVRTDRTLLAELWNIKTTPSFSL